MSQIPQSAVWWALSQTNGDDGDDKDKKEPPKRFPWEDVMLIAVIFSLMGLTAWFMFWK